MLMFVAHFSLVTEIIITKKKPSVYNIVDI